MPQLSKPTPDAVLQARKAVGLTQELAGQVLGAHNRQWRMYEAGDRAMSAQLWELFLLKTNQHPTLRLESKG